MSDAMFQRLPIDLILDATVETFNISNARNHLSGLLTRDKLAGAHGIMASRPFSQYRDICALLAKKYGDIDDSMFQTLLRSDSSLGIPGMVDAAARAERNLKQGNTAYTIPYDKLIATLLPPEMQAYSRARSMIEANDVVDKPIELNGHRKPPPPIQKSLPAPEAESMAAPAGSVYLNKKGQIAIPSDKVRRINIKNDGPSNGKANGHAPVSTPPEEKPSPQKSCAAPWTAAAVPQAAPVRTPKPITAAASAPSKLPLTRENITRAAMWSWNSTFPQQSVSTLDMFSRESIRAPIPRQIAAYADRVLRGDKEQFTRQEEEIAGKVQMGDRIVIDILNRMIGHLDCTETQAFSLLNPELTLPAPDAKKFADYVKQPLTIGNIKDVTVSAWNNDLLENGGHLVSHGRFLRVTADLINSPERKEHISRPRQISMYVCASVLPAKTTGSLPAIGKHHGERDHTTVLHAYRKIADMLTAGDEKIARIIGKMVERLDCSPQQAHLLLNPSPQGRIRRRPALESPRAP